jgi:MFS family permease
LHTFHLFDLKRLRSILLTSFGIFLAGWFFFSLALSSFSSLYPVLMLKSFKIFAAKSSLLMSAATALSIPLYNVTGRLTSRRGPTSILISGMVVRMIALAGLGLFGIFHLPSNVIPAILPVIILFGSFQGIWPLLSVASNDLSAVLADFSKGTASGLFNAAAAVASAAGAILGGVVADRFGYSSVGLFAALGIAVALMVVLRLRRIERGATNNHATTQVPASS